jgi:hypothetical protein
MAFPGNAALTADIVLDFEVGRLNAGGLGPDYNAETGALPSIAKVAPYQWRTQVLAADGERVLNELIGRYTLGATLYKTKGFYKGVGAPGYVIRILGSDLDRDLPDAGELEAIAKALSAQLAKVFHQWDVWVLFTDASGGRSLFRASTLSEKDVQRARTEAGRAYQRLKAAS